MLFRSFYKAAGVEIEYIPVQTSAGVFQQLSAGSLDMGAGFTNNNTVRADGDVYLKAGMGVSAGIEGGVLASTNITQSNNIDVGADTHVFNSTVYEAGGKAETGAHANLSPLNGNLTVGANAFAGGYVSLGETVGVDSHGVTATAGGAVITPGSAGVGFAPLIGEQDGKYNLGIHVAVAAGIGGVTFDGNISLDKDMVNHGVMTGVNAVAGTGSSVGHTIADGTTGVANTVAHGATDAAHAANSAITGAANAAGSAITGGVTGAANTVAHGATDAAHATGAAITGAANTAGSAIATGATDAAHAAG